MRHSCTYAIIVFGLFMLNACTKKESGKTTLTTSVHGSPYTYLLAGTHSFHYMQTGYSPPLMSTFTHTFDTTIHITFLDSGTVLFSSDTFRYDSADASGLLHYVYATPTPSISPGYGYLKFDRVADTMNAWVDQHVSAGAGDWINTYSSF